MPRYSNHPVKHLSTRYYLVKHLLNPEKAIPKELHNRLLSDNDIFPQGQQERMERAVTEDLVVYPISKTSSQVLSGESEYIVSGEPPACQCEDFLFNCDYRHGEYCKHVWTVEFLQSCGVIPKSEPPQNWLIEQIQMDLSSAAEGGFDKIIPKGLQLLSDISEKEPHYTNWREFYSRWLQLLTIYQQEYSRTYLTKDINIGTN